MNFLLYVIPKDTNSKKAAYLSGRDTHIVNAQLEPRPKWLKGVPTLVDIKTKAVYEGSECLKFLEFRRRADRCKYVPTLEVVNEKNDNTGVLFTDDDPEEEEKEEEEVDEPRENKNALSLIENQEEVDEDEEPLENLLVPQQTAFNKNAMKSIPEMFMSPIGSMMVIQMQAH